MANNPDNPETIRSLLTGPAQDDVNCPTDWDVFVGFMSRLPQRLEACVPASQGTSLFQLNMTNIHRLAFGCDSHAALNDEVRVNQSG